MTSTLRITRRAADRLREGHLWVYRSDIESSGGELAAGMLVTVVDAREIPLGTALYSTTSQIAARVISRKPAVTREQYVGELRERIEAALQLRRELAPFAPDNNAHRLIFAEADNLPGIIADRYNDLILLQLLTQGTAQEDVRDIVVEVLRGQFAAQGESLTIWERPDPRIRELEQLGPPPQTALFTTAASAEGAPATTTFALNGIKFQYDASAGQKTGAFLDQRLNYAAAERWVRASGRSGKGSRLRALDVCTYQGGFALHLARVCSHVTGVDQSRAALEGAERNLGLNPEIGSGCEVDWLEADAFALLRALDDARRDSSAGEGLPVEAGAFDAIVLDPPAFAKSKRAAEGALRGYKELNLRAIRLMAAGGTLITCSCSHHVSLQDFSAVVAAAAADANRRVQLLEVRAAARDHPEVLTLPETMYLKCLICRVD